MKNLILFFFLLSLATACSQNANKQVGNGTGLALYEKNCNACHNATDPFEGRLAPPAVAIKMHYQMDRADFIEQVSSYILNPTAENSKMKGAIKRFGLMPKQMISEKEARQIAAFIHDTDMESPNWFEEHRKEMAEQTIDKDYGQIGQELARQTQQVLGKNLMEAMAKGGPENALEFCNISAITLTDSMAIALNTSIKRVSDKTRNPDNKAGKEELAYIRLLHKQIEEGSQLKPMVISKGAKVKAYYPIVSNGMCLQCHGKEIAPKVAAKINELYPEDLATGYKANELRGIWVVEMDK